MGQVPCCVTIPRAVLTLIFKFGCHQYEQDARGKCFCEPNLFSLSSEGEYAGFDEMQPTAESGGKGKVIRFLKEKFHFKKIIMIGDGATDMEACPPAVRTQGCWFFLFCFFSGGNFFFF